MSFKRYCDYGLGIPLSWLLFPFLKTKKSVPPRINRILVIKLAAMGDTILLIPVLRSLRKAFPDAQIDWLVSAINRTVAKTVPYVDHTLVWPGFSVFPLFKLIGRLRNERYDAVIDFEQWARGTAILSFLSGAPLRLGFETPGQHRSLLFTKTHSKHFDTHEINDFFRLASLAGNLEHDSRLELWEQEEGKSELSRIPWFEAANKKGILRVILHPGCGNDGRPREWPLPSYAVLAQWLQKNYGAEIFLTSGPEEREKTGRLLKLLNGKACDLGGQLTWLGLISLVKKMDLLVSGNTGIMHIAAALNKKQVALHGPTNPALWGPLNPQAAIVKTDCPQCPSLRLGFEYHRRNQDCMRRIEIEAVKKAVREIVDK